MPQPMNLTGIWAADDGAIYHVAHNDDGVVWWIGMHGWTQFHQGVFFANVFHGRLCPETGMIDGDWVDAPRGSVLAQGHIALDVVTLPPVPGTAGLRHELRRRDELTTGGFGGSVWRRRAAGAGIPGDIEARLASVRRAGGLPNGDASGPGLRPAGGFVIVTGRVAESGTGLNWSAAEHGYCAFVRGEGGGDGTLSFDLLPDLPGRPEALDPHAAGLTSDRPLTLGPDDGVLAGGEPVTCRMIMYGRANDEAGCGRAPRVLLPGWREQHGDSVLICGLPINGSAFLSDGRIAFRVLRGRAGIDDERFRGEGLADHFPIEDPFHPAHTTEGRPVDLRLEPGTRVRVIGALNADLARPGRAELHPVYRVDVLQDFARRPAGAELTGAWQADDGGTYFIRQIGNELWWLGMSRDLGAEFLTVFRGTIGPDGINGDWADVSGTRDLSHGTLGLAYGPAGSMTVELVATARTGGTGASTWRKLYDERWWHLI
ncbi:hypothetical protein ACIBK1_02340 [Microbispora rosea]|uniref:hypothetical protein n=1 Tax=Microbispora rosea TaxID=58117 RepID=UPI0004C3EB66|nr:hypothetical protein [Microbispora rosea]